MRQEFFNLELKTNGQKLYEFTDQTIDWINKNNFNNGILNLSIQPGKSATMHSVKLTAVLEFGLDENYLNL